MSPDKGLEIIKQKKIKKEWKIAFLAAFGIGLLIHTPMLLSDIPNHDGLDSMYFDQNMVTSGRWFLMVACGFSSFYTLPWLIGLLGLFFLALAAAALAELLEVKKGYAIVLISGLLVSFPALASTFAYMFTMDGYMLALLLAVLSVLLTKKYRWGFLPGAVCLAFSMGTYQSYLPFAMILSVFSILLLLAEQGSVQEKAKKCAAYLLNGIIGGALYYILLQILLKLQGKELDTYQGINGMASGTSSQGLLSIFKKMYQDFAAFTIKGNVLFHNPPSTIALLLLSAAAVVLAVKMAGNRKWWKNPFFFVIIIGTLAVLPVITNIILLISPDVNYHLLMRYQWILYPIGMIAFVSRNSKESRKGADVLEWLVLAAGFVLVFHYAVTDNIAYSNLEKKYEKTYAYCIRLLDRIEQTEGYYPGIPIAMIGVVSDEQYPSTDLTLPVTSNMIGMNGDGLLYTGDNYREFIKYYLGATLNIQPAEAMAEVYYSEEYQAMDSFPGENAIRIIDGVMYVKTENASR